ncbi:tripartite tricarboxylate transporter substrate-binding protein [Muricoccus vinaceus]|uniref:Tripartite tricarboxylate transporter substrate-binding protein n=1 Tax=Muricoccus vinaceus TaxID=424704 RepID=A0ABV6IR78_9PROT
MDVTRRRLLALPLAAPALIPGPGQAQASWAPVRPVRMIVPFAAGGPTDIIARLLQEPLAVGLGQPVVVENRPGAGGNIGIQAVARAAPDGHTLLFCSSAFAANPALQPADRPAIYDPLRDFAPITVAVTSPNAIVAHPGAGIAGLAAMVARARAEPGRLDYSSPGSGTGPHLTAEMFRRAVGVELTHVPFNGGAPGIQAVLAGTVPLGFSAMPAAQTHIRAGALIGLATTGPSRWPDLPDMPTVDEAVLPGFQAETWQSMLAPAGTPAAATARIAEVVAAVLRGAASEQRLRGIGFRPVASTPTAFAAQLATEVPALAALVREAGIRAD